MRPDQTESSLIIDLESVNNLQVGEKKTSRATIGGIDLASGHRLDHIWVTRDGRRIPISEMSDDHLKNVLEWIKKMLPRYRMQLSYKMLIKVAMVVDIFGDPVPIAEADKAFDTVRERARELAALPDELFLSQYIPIYGHLYQEAYKRKLVLP